MSDFASSNLSSHRDSLSASPSSAEGFIYLLHWSHRSGRVEHYVGWTTNLEARLKAHSSGSGGCPTTRKYRRASMRGRLVRLWRGTIWGERKLQQTLLFPTDCPICCGHEIETVPCEGYIQQTDAGTPVASSGGRPGKAA